jgi:hypothetical protein
MWVMGCIKSFSFILFINGAASPFFKPKIGIRKGCPLSLLLFLLVVEGLNISFREASTSGSFKCILVGNSCHVSHLLFVDDILIFCNGSKRMLYKLKEIMDLFCETTSMKINSTKLMISYWGLLEVEKLHISQLFPFPTIKFDIGFKYLGFNLKSNPYLKGDWQWIYPT